MLSQSMKRKIEWPLLGSPGTGLGTRVNSKHKTALRSKAKCPFLNRDFTQPSAMLINTHLNEGLSRVPRVRPYNESRILTPLHHSLFQLITPDVLTSLKNVIAVANHSYRPCGKLVQQTLECILLSALAPGDDSATERPKTV